MNPIPVYQVDAFTNAPFAGNPAAVVLLEQEAPEAWMQSFAMEMNLSETAYIVPNQDRFNLRWFTPKVEVDLCGHATLASAHILWETGVLGSETPAVFDTRSGELVCCREADRIRMDFPAASVTPAVQSESLEAALRTTIAFTGKTSGGDLLLEVESDEAVRTLKPNLALLAREPVRGVIVTSLTDQDDYDFISRFFAPQSGVAEDPATGSAHCALATYWNMRTGKHEFHAYQASRRGGILHVSLKGERVELRGQAVTTLAGSISPQGTPAA